MPYKTLLAISLVLAFSSLGAAQNTNSSTTARPRSTNTNTGKPPAAQKSSDTQPPTTAPAAAKRTEPKPKVAATEVPGSAGVVSAFDALLEGIRKANVKMVTGVYLNSPRLLLFNNNGTVTRGWEQLRKNRESSYPQMKDVNLEVKDVQITMLGRDGALVTCLWNQSQTYQETPETASGRMTLVFKRIGKDWKAVHLHTSPDKPDPSRVMPSEQTPSPSPTPAASPTP
ncbi:MAG TPA: nuclear transport factor 2 family protein [Pyrinomonadaceae bacterium]|nr:nuclear transport factor 2 family protein [Pyrinomonadaceae bacterium]